MASAQNRQLISVIVPLKIGWEPVYFAPPETEITIGQRVRVDFSGKEYVAAVSAVGVGSDLPESRILGIKAIAEDLAPVSPQEIEFWREIAGYYLCSVGEVYKAAYPALRITQEEIRARMALKKKEAERKAGASKKRRKTAGSGENSAGNGENAAGGGENTAENGGDRYPAPAGQRVPRLSPAQQKAKEEIKAAFAEGKTALLDGVTGSGKTEIYISLAADTLAAGKNVLYLVPEIALSRQLEDRLREYLADALHIFHSGESTVRRALTCEAVRNGTDAYVVLGTRSSLFLPHRNLGLVIVDEEQDTSYKQDSPAPRYNGRDSAALLARIHGAPLLLGTATPSLESLYNCMAGRYRRVVLRERYHGGADADVEIIDTTAEMKKNGMLGSISRKLAAAMQDCFADGGQAIVLRARKSYSTYIQCVKCGEIVRCPHCNVSLSYSRVRNRMLCHHCGYSVAFTGKCIRPGCDGELKLSGTGTEKVEDELQTIFPDRTVARLDADVSSAAEQKRIIRDFEAGRTDILVGTQMVSKGFDFKGLRLVALIQADSILGVDDFRADEKASQLLEQFRGRCGRRGEKGLFIVQTACPAHPLYGSIQSPEQTRSYENLLLGERKEYGFPPYSRVINVILKDRNEARLERNARNLGLELRSTGVFAGDTASHSFVNKPGEINITGPFAPALSKSADEHVRLLRITLPKDRRLVARKEALRQAIAGFRLQNGGTDISVDVDPA